MFCEQNGPLNVLSPTPQIQIGSFFLFSQETLENNNRQQFLPLETNLNILGRWFAAFISMHPERKKLKYCLVDE